MQEIRCGDKIHKGNIEYTANCLKASQAVMEIMDEVRRQIELVFSADKYNSNY